MGTLGGVSFLVACFIGVWIASLFLVIFFSILRRRISLNGLLVEPLSGKHAPFSRPQLLLSTFAGLGVYVATAIANLGKPAVLPDAPAWLIATFAGSHTIYLGGRAVSGLLSNFFRGR